MIASRRWRTTHPDAISMRRPPASGRAAALPIVLALAGCSSWSSSGESMFGFLSLYRIDIQQGNVVTQEQLARVKPGMNRLQVRDALGSPLLTDAFHPDRWDYIFTLRQSGKPLQRRNVVLVFDGDVLKSVEAPELPSEREFVDSIARSGRMVAAADLELTPEQLKNLPIPAKTVPPPPADTSTPATPRSYPPLEPS
jgi:outer membrane protein assembly factor BamE